MEAPIKVSTQKLKRALDYLEYHGVNEVIIIKWVSSEGFLNLRISGEVIDKFHITLYDINVDKESVMERTTVEKL